MNLSEFGIGISSLGDLTSFLIGHSLNAPLHAGRLGVLQENYERKSEEAFFIKCSGVGGTWVENKTTSVCSEIPTPWSWMR
jgi:hypothetical protein|nr:hypothetical protein Q903MT_gene6058 [Picea sitchensis]